MNPEQQFLQEIEKISGVIVSVGCGMGIMENQLRNMGKIVICIDPNNRDMVDRYTGDKRVLMPDYPTVTDFLKDKPKAVNKVNLLLSHPLPDYNLYDIMAIKRLEPRYIFLKYMKKGGAGSWFLHRFLRKNNIKTLGKLRTDESIKIHISPSVCVVKYEYNKVWEKDVSKHIDERLQSYLIMKISNFIGSDVCEFDYNDTEETCCVKYNLKIQQQFYYNLNILQHNINNIVSESDEDA